MTGRNVSFFPTAPLSVLDANHAMRKLLLQPRVSKSTKKPKPEISHACRCPLRRLLQSLGECIKLHQGLQLFAPSLVELNLPNRLSNRL
jgi:hypothetical protein